jgi:Icc-related predicted phosphoesterase
MRILTVSDEVVPVVYSLNAAQRFRDVALICGCGDLPYYYLEFLVTTLAVPCLYVHGNHDRVEIGADGCEIGEPRGCENIDGRTIEQGGLLLAGLGGSIRYSRDSRYQYSEQEMMLRAWRLMPFLLLNRLRYGRYLDVLLTHAPPLGIHNGPDFPHRGFRAFCWLMDHVQPRYLVHGHIHLSYGFGQISQTWYRQTLVMNTSGFRILTIQLVETCHN